MAAGLLLTSPQSTTSQPTLPASTTTGPDTIKSCRATIKSLESSLVELKGTTKVQRFMQMQAQLAEADKVRVCMCKLHHAA